MPLEIVRNDITKMRVDAVVNAANSGLQRGGGVCGAIFAAAGAGELERECAKIGGCATGSAVITGGGKLPAKFIIHTVGPVWQGGGFREDELLARCYKSCFSLAERHGIRSIAFPAISAGAYGFPMERACRIALSEIKAFLDEGGEKKGVEVIAVCYSPAAYQCYQKVLSEL